MRERDWIWNKREDGISIRISGTRVLLGKFVTRRFRTGRFPLVRIFFSWPIASVPQNGGKSARRREFLIDEGDVHANEIYTRFIQSLLRIRKSAPSEEGWLVSS